MISVPRQSLIAMAVEKETTANFNDLLEDEGFYNMAIKELKLLCVCSQCESKNDIFESARILSQYANEHLI